MPLKVDFYLGVEKEIYCFTTEKDPTVYFKGWICLLQEITRAIRINMLIMIRQVFHGSLTSMLISLGKFWYKLLQHGKWKADHSQKGLFCQVLS